MGNEFKKPYIIGETAYNHEGSIKYLYRMIDEIDEVGLNAIKFQTFIAEKFVTKKAKMADYQKENIGEIKSQFDMLKELEPIYLSYFYPWDGRKNYEIAKKFGFKNLNKEWEREGFIEDYDQIDSIGYLVHPWLKYPKFGHARATDVSC